MTPKNFLTEYLTAHSGTMVPRRYSLWAAVAIMAMTLGRKVWFNMEHFKIHTEFHTFFIGNAGIRKSTPKNDAKRMFTTALPDYPLGPSISSREEIVRYLASAQCKRYFKDLQGLDQEWTPCAYFINEFTNFMSFNPKGMIEFLTDIFESDKEWDSATLARGREKIPYPFLIILACTTPRNFGKYMKSDIIGEGFSRRLIPVYVAKQVDRITRPIKSHEAWEAEAWCIEHIRKVDGLLGQFEYDSEETFQWFDEWNRTRDPHTEDNVMTGYFESRDIIATKVAMCLAACEEEPKLLLTQPILQTAISHMEDNEAMFARLIAPTGRNEIVVPQQRLLTILEARGGAMPEKEFHRFASADLTEGEYGMMKRMLINTDQLYELEGTIMTHEAIIKVRAIRELEKRRLEAEKATSPVASSEPQLPLVPR